MDMTGRPMQDQGVWWPGTPRAVAHAGAALDGRLRWVVWLACVATLGAAFAGDYLTGPELAWSIFYVAPVALAAWHLGRSATFAAVLAGAWLMLTANYLGGAGTQLALFWNAGVGGAFLLVVAYMLRLLRHALIHERELARTDWLTGLPNARSFLETTAHEIARSRRTGTPLTLAYIDLDGFKALNDGQGHAAGDAVLQQVGAALRHGVRDVDMVARLGGDEFTLLLPDTGAEAAAQVLARLQKAIHGSEGAGTWPVRFSTGAVTIRGAGYAEDLIRQADAAMYEAKRRGGNQIRVMDLAA